MPRWRHESTRGWFSFSRHVFSLLARQTRFPHVAASPRRLRIRVLHRVSLDIVRQEVFDPTPGRAPRAAEESTRVFGHCHRTVRPERD
jgi:hypothetical protein